MIRCIKYHRGRLAENPTGAIVTFRLDGQDRLAEVSNVYYREFPPAYMLNLRYFNGEAAPDVAASAARLVLPDPED